MSNPTWIAALFGVQFSTDQRSHDMVSMPTPIQHLSIADALLHESTLPGSIRDWLLEHRAAFLFGNTAPDVQTISGQPREVTHFFKIPFRSTPLPHRTLFEAYPGLSRPRSISPAHAAFMAGYICHLWLDVIWVRDVYLPGFGPEAAWLTMHDRLLYHNILRAWCDQHDQSKLNGNTGPSLAAAQPRDWLPFTADRYLIQWRDQLADQFQPGANIRTVEVFALRNRVPPAEFHRVLESPQALEDNIFAHVSQAAIAAFYQHGHDQLAELIIEYLREP